MENDLEELESQTNKNDNQMKEEEIPDYKLKKQTSSKPASKRPIQRAKETLDIEPLEEKKLVIDNNNSESFEIDDPW